ncbi:MAG TPA: hypothetical protein VF070_49980 [Streptosporangiaceae bacterium]
MAAFDETRVYRVYRGGRAATQALALAVGVIAIQFIMVTAYAWSATSTAPRNVPVAIAGPARAVALVTGELDTAKPGAFKLLPASTMAQARQDITSRQAYGAILVSGPGRINVLVASGGSPAVTSVLTTMAATMDGVSTRPANVTDIVPTTASDQTGAAFGFTVLPLVLSSLIAGVVLTLRVPDPSRRAAALAAFGIGGGLVSAAVAHTWLGVIPGNFLPIACAMGLAALAAAAGVSGLAHFGARFGKRHVGLGAGGAIIMLLGNPFSGMSTAPEMLPGIWGFIGQCLPTGASATLLRSVAYFDGARSAGPWTVLGIWAGAGLLLTLTAHRPIGNSSSPDTSFSAPSPAVLSS